MLRVGLVHAKPGMTLALPVYHPERPDTVLLRSGVRLEESVIRRLREIHCKEVWIRYPGLDFIAEYINPAVVNEQQRVVRAVSEAIDAILNSSDPKLDYLAYKRAVTSLLEKLSENPKANLYLQEMVDDHQPALRHACNTCYLSLLMGLKLEFYMVQERSRLAASNARDVSNLGVGAIFHDLGMLRLDPETLDRWNRTQDESDEAWREHVRLGFQMIRGEIEPSAATAVLHHHQRFDGSGFPQKSGQFQESRALSGNQIHIFARVVAAADLFDRIHHPANALRAEAIGRPSLPVVRALRRMMEPPYSDWIDPVVRTALFAVVPPYPPGSVVTLSDGRSGVVADWSAENPCRPVVDLVGDVSRNFKRASETHERVDLRKELELEVVEAEGHEVRQDNFYPKHGSEFDLEALAKAMVNGVNGMDVRRSA